MSKLTLGDDFPICEDCHGGFPPDVNTWKLVHLPSSPILTGVWEHDAGDMENELNLYCPCRRFLSAWCNLRPSWLVWLGDDSIKISVT